MWLAKPKIFAMWPSYRKGLPTSALKAYSSCIKIFTWAGFFVSSSTSLHVTERESVAQLCPTLCYNPMDCSRPGSSVHEILQAILEWVAILSSRGSARPRDQIQIFCIAGRFLTELPRSPFNSGVNLIQVSPHIWGFSVSWVTQSRLTLCDPMDCMTPGLPIHHQLLELAQTHVHRVGDALQSSHPLSSPSPCLQSFPASGSFPVSQFFTSGGQRIGVSASASVLPMNIQDWFPLGWTGWISLQSKGHSRVFSNITVQKHQFFGTQLSLWSNSHIHTWLLEKP